MNPQSPVEEKYGKRFNRVYHRDGITTLVVHESDHIRQWTSLSNFFMTVFLPHGYPDTVSKDYLQYQLWDSVQAFASSITGSLSTHAILRGAGVGDETASSLAATMAWIVKDGTSMIGRIVFSWLQGTKLDCDCKKWRLFADVLNDLALFLDLISAHFKDYFILIMCISGVFKSIVGVAGGATRAALTQHQARQNNMADVSAKDGSQETLVNLAALICSLFILPVVAENSILVWFLYILMTTVHLFANYFAIKSVQMETFNSSRFLLYMEEYINSDMGKYTSVAEVNEMESVLLLPLNEPVIIKMGVSFSDITKCKSFGITNKLIALYRNCSYLVTVSESLSNQVIIYICLQEKSTVTAQLESMYQACLLRDMYYKSVGKKGILWTLYDLDTWHSDIGVEEFTRNLTRKEFATFLRRTQMCGWRADVAMFNADLWRVKW